MIFKIGQDKQVAKSLSTYLNDKYYKILSQNFCFFKIAHFEDNIFNIFLQSSKGSSVQLNFLKQYINNIDKDIESYLANFFS